MEYAVILACACLNAIEICANTILDYESFLNKNFQKAATYQFPNDASKFKPKNPNIEDAGTFDFIIIGAGSTGAVLANRLSEIKDWSILLLDAGDFIDNFSSIPGLITTGYLTEYNWPLYSVPQNTSCLGLKGNSCPNARGFGIGGTSIINGVIYSRGSPTDFDNWKSLGNTGWSYEEVLPYFKKSEKFVKTDPFAVVDEEAHGEHGYMTVEHSKPKHVYDFAFVDANEELGYKLTDYNGRDVLGPSPTQYNIKDGIRQDTGTAFIKPILHRNNLKVSTKSFVTKIIINSKREATGIKFTRNGTLYTSRARKEVIVSAGALSTPQILMLSGIGPRKHLSDLDIPVVANLEVGSVLRDHIVYYLGLSFGTNVYASKISLREQLEDYLYGEGQLAVTGNLNSLGFYQSSLEKQKNYPDIEVLMLSPQNPYGPARNFLPFTTETSIATWGGADLSTVRVSVANLHSHSTGQVRLKSKDPFEFPLVDNNLLSDTDNHDIDVIYEGIQLALNIFLNTTAFRKLNSTLQTSPLPQCSHYIFASKEYWYCSIRYLSKNAFHPMGTCPMGPKSTPGAVVDPKLKVHGIKNLRVADASIIPATPSGHPSAICMMIGEKLADMIKEQYCFKPFSAINICKTH